jgi:AcrR family transcriptional regulator
MAPPFHAEAAILRATEDLLETCPLSDLSVSAICRHANVSRQGFYLHFAGKNAVVLAAMRRLVDQVFVAIAPFLRHAADSSVDETLRSSLADWFSTCHEHRVLVRTFIEEWPRDRELQELYVSVLERSTRDVAAIIAADRRAGIAPPGADPLALAATLMWGFERALYPAMLDDAAMFADPTELIEALAQLLVGSVYARSLAPAA